MIGLSCNREDQYNVDEVEKPGKLVLPFTAPMVIAYCLALEFGCCAISTQGTCSESLLFTCYFTYVTIVGKTLCMIASPCNL